MNPVALDASAVLALLNEEEGAGEVESMLGRALISTVNFSEVVGKLVLQRVPAAKAAETVGALDLEIVAFDREQAEVAASLAGKTHRLGLSLGDRACLALAAVRKVPVLTADRAWKKLELGISIRLIRP